MTPITYTLSAEDMLAGNRLAIRSYVRKGVPRFSLAVLIVSAGVTLLSYSLNPQPLPIIGALFAKITAIYIAAAAILVAILLLWTPRQRAKKEYGTDARVVAPTDGRMERYDHYLHIGKWSRSHPADGSAPMGDR